MNYRIYTRLGMANGATYVVLEVDGEFIREKYCMTTWGAKWYAYWLNAQIRKGNARLDDNLYTGEIK